MLDWLRQLFSSVCDFIRDLFSDMIDWLLSVFQDVIEWFRGLFGSSWDWVKDLVSSLFGKVGIDQLFEYTEDFVSQIVNSPVISTLSDVLNHCLPWVPWSFLGWSFTFVVFLYLHVMVYRLARKLIFRV